MKNNPSKIIEKKQKVKKTLRTLMVTATSALLREATVTTWVLSEKNIYGQGHERETENMPFDQKFRIVSQLNNLASKCSIVYTLSYSICFLVVMWSYDPPLPSFYESDVSQFDITSNNQNQIFCELNSVISFKFLKHWKQ